MLTTFKHCTQPQDLPLPSKVRPSAVVYVDVTVVVVASRVPQAKLLERRRADVAGDARVARRRHLRHRGVDVKHDQAERRQGQGLRNLSQLHLPLIQGPKLQTFYKG